MRAIFARAIAAYQHWRHVRAAARADAHALETTRRYWDDGVALSLADLVQSTETKASGRVQVLSLAEFRSHIGPLWDQYAEKILLIAETTIARMIGKGNTFIPQGDDAWLFLFPELEPAEARDHADMIAAKLGEKLVGESFAADIPPPPLTVILDTAGVVRADGTLNAEAFHAAVEKARTTKSVAAKPRAAEAQLIHQVRLRPAWSAETQAIDTFVLRPRGASGEDLLADTARAAAIGQPLCAAAARTLAEMDQRGLRARLVMQLPWVAFVANTADALRAQLMAIPQKTRLMHLRIDVLHIPAATSIENIAALREGLRPLIREVGLEVDPQHLDSGLFTLNHAVFVASAKSIADAARREVLLKLRQAAGQQRLAVEGLVTRKQVLEAMSAGVDEISGLGLGPDIQSLPEKTMALPRRDFAV